MRVVSAVAAMLAGSSAMGLAQEALPNGNVSFTGLLQAAGLALLIWIAKRTSDNGDQIRDLRTALFGHKDAPETGTVPQIDRKLETLREDVEELKDRRRRKTDVKAEEPL